MKVLAIRGENFTLEGIQWYCPGCECDHSINMSWIFNGSYTNPTITPSVLVKSYPVLICHSYVTNGHIQFLTDCTHKLAGQTVEMVDV